MNRIVKQLEQQACACPQAIAIRSGNESISYAQLMSSVRQVSRLMQSRQVQSLGIYLDNGIDWIIVDLAGMVCGIRIVPLPWFFSDRQIDHAIDDGAVDHLVFAAELPSGILGTGTPVQFHRDTWLQPVTRSQVTPSDTPTVAGKLSYTSGSTGSPKGIGLAYQFIDQASFSISAAVADLGIESHLSILPYATLLENIAGVYVPLMQGKTVFAESAECVGLSADLRLDPLKLMQTFNRVRPDSLILTPQLLELLCLLVEGGAIDPACLVFVAVGGARVGEPLMQRARRAGIPAYEGYGLTEFGSVAILNTPSNDRVGSVGKPLPGIQVDIATDGAIVLSTQVTRMEAGVIRQHTVRVETGDLGSIDSDGFVYIHGRKSNLIVLSTGRNVSPEWVEAELNASPLIQQSYVFTATQSDLSALLVTAAADVADADLEAEIDRINLMLPRYARINSWQRPAQPFSLDNQMLTANGRLRRGQIEQRLPELLAEAKSVAAVTTRCDSGLFIPGE